MDYFSGRPLASLNETDIAEFVSRSVPEGPSLDYKESIELKSDRDKREFLADVTAFANADGGMIIVGVKEKRDDDGKPMGIPDSLTGFPLNNSDELCKLIDSLARELVDERLPGLETAPMHLENGNFALLIRVAASLRAPHMVLAANDRQFYRRVNSGKEKMTTALIRDVVLRSDSAAERIRSFVQKRLDAIQNQANGRPYWALHIVPMFHQPDRLDLANREIYQRLRLLEAPGRHQQGLESLHSIDGFKIFTDVHGELGYVLVFRDGAIECVDQYSLQQSNKAFRFWDFESNLFRCFENVSALCKEGYCPLPAVIFLNLGNLGEYVIQLFEDDRTSAVWQKKALPGGTLNLGTSVIVDTAQLATQVFKPMLNLIWQAAGFARCPAYDDGGQYVGYEGNNWRARVF